ncbi:BTAD domain-containing putative transcriptional regulator [Lentzea sp. E54]|uniref:BTAD domain-containing putative transcriptional regulator n=1 Tax=Lentzea xerophila TaxID=3435883 RepID=UPI003DA65604
MTSSGERWCVWRVLVGTVRILGRTIQGLIAATMLAMLVAGLPWALWHFVGWPLPDHIPTWIEVEVLLLAPMSATFLLNLLACLCWIFWAAFSIGVLRSAVDYARDGIDAARHRDFSDAGPMNTVASLLIGAVLVAVLGNRPAPSLATPWPIVETVGSQIVATAPAWHQPAPDGEVEAVHHAAVTSHAPGGGGAVTDSANPESVVVLAPHHGVHDSLWRIADRTLGDGTRWPEIFELNKGKPQPNGQPFTKPSLIFPGEELALPRDASAPAQPPHQATPDQTSPAPPATPSPTSSASPTGISPSTAPPPEASTQHTAPADTTTTSTPGSGEPGFRWGTELFVGLGLAAAVSAALMLARHHYRSRYRPGSGDRDDLPVAPVVYQLRLAHLRAERGDVINPDDETAQRPRRAPALPPLALGGPRTDAGQPRGLTAGVGVRDGREIALDLANARGLGLVGPGAPAAARALLITALTIPADHLATSAGPSIFVPADDLTSVLGRPAPHEQLPSTMRVVADLDEALDAIEAETLVRATALRSPGTEQRTWPPLVLVTRPPTRHQRLQAVLDNGAQCGVIGLMVGQWQPGITCYVRADGTISATGPGPGEALRGTVMFRLGDNDTAELLALLHQAKPDPHADNEVLAAAHEPPPHSAAAHLIGHDHHTATQASRRGTGSSNAGQVELEVTATVTQPAPQEVSLEILDAVHSQPEGDPPSLPEARRPSLSALRLADSETGPRDGGAVTDEPVSANTPTTSAPPHRNADGERGASPALITVTVLGSLRVHWHPELTGSGAKEITGKLQPRSQELLVLLALHPDGATRDTLVSALWGQDLPARPTNALHTALARLRHALAVATDGAVSDIVVADNGRYQLDPSHVHCDYWRFERAVAARRNASTDQTRVNAYRDVVNSYGGPLAEAMSTEWIEPVREAIRRDAVDAVAALARALVETDPQQTLDLLEVARAFDPHNELLYRDIMRLQERLGQLDAIPRTLTLLTTRLAEVDATPTAQARALADQLRQRHDDLAGARNSLTQSAPGRGAAG